MSRSTETSQKQIGFALDKAENEMVAYWEKGFSQKAKDKKAFYDINRLPPVAQASHTRRLGLLNSLPVGDLSDKVCVDYGVGPWGFGSIYQRLQQCRYAIGIDISEQAIRISEEIARTGNFPYGQNYQFLTSLGNEISLDESSVDLFFAGEAIEHVDDVVAFLNEVHRVLKPDGLLIVTTPNADAYVYKLHDERYCFNGEHISLMSFSELQSYLHPGFDILTAKGFNGSFYRTLDDKITDSQVIADWVNYFEDRPDMATGVIILARKRNSYQPNRYLHHYYNHTSPAIQYQGRWEVCNLLGPLTGKRGHPDWGSRLSLEFEGEGLLVDLWGHDWSGSAEFEVDGAKKKVNLYSPVGGFHKVRFSKLGPGSHKLTISTCSEKDTRSLDSQLILWRLITIGHPKSISSATISSEQLSTSDQVKAARAPIYQPPSSLDLIFTAPAEQLLPERFLIYSLIFGLRPRHCLEIGTHWGGSASIICSAMDDVGQGHLVCVDPQPLVAPETWEKIKHRVDLLRGWSPDILSQAQARSEAPFDFVLIDGDHTYQGVLRDIEGVLPYLANEAYLLFHDSHYYEIKEAISEAVRRYPLQLHDAGGLSSSSAPENREVNGQAIEWGGLRLLRFTRNHQASAPERARLTDEQLNSLQTQLRLTQEKLSLIENTRTWQLSSKFAYSPFGRFLSRFIKLFWR